MIDQELSEEIDYLYMQIIVNRSIMKEKMPTTEQHTAAIKLDIELNTTLVELICMEKNMPDANKYQGQLYKMCIGVVQYVFEKTLVDNEYKWILYY